MRVIVTGAAGYIGAHVSRKLAVCGHDVAAVDSFERGHRFMVGDHQLFAGKLEDRDWLKHIIETFSPDAVVHMAGYISVEESLKFPELYRAKNVEVSRGLISVMTYCGVRKLIFPSTAAVYADTGSEFLSEDDPVLPASPYAACKLEVEDMIMQSGISAVVFRFFNAAGADISAGIGEAHDPETHVIPTMISCAMSGREFVINGDDFPTHDGTAVRDYVHVSDLSEAHARAVSMLDSIAGFRLFNIGAGRGVSVKELVRQLELETGILVKKRIGKRREGDAARLVADCRRAERDLGWSPRSSDLGAILRTAFAWHQSRA